MSDDAPVQAPTDIVGVGIHLSYLRRDMKEMKDTLSNITSNYVPISIFVEYRAISDKRIEVLEKKVETFDNDKANIRGRLWGIWIVITIVASIFAFTINKFL